MRLSTRHTLRPEAHSLDGASGVQVSSGLSKDMDAAWLACEALAARLDKGRAQPSAGVRELAGARVLRLCSEQPDAV